jgi:hypothetical protein
MSISHAAIDIHAVVAQHELHCSRIPYIEARMDKFEARQVQHEEIVQRIIGAIGLWKILVPTSAAVVIVTTIWRFVLDLRGHR